MTAIKKLLQVVLPLGLAALMLWLVFRKTDFVQIGNLLAKARWELVALSLVPVLVSNISRARRWCLLLEPVTIRPTLMEAFWAVMGGYLANLALPRLGELTRCTLLARRRGIPVEISLGTVIAERAFDLIMLGVITVLSMLLQFKQVNSFFARLLSGSVPADAEGKGVSGLLIIAAICGVGGLIVLILLRERLLELSFIKKILQFAKGLLSGLLSAFQLKRRGEFLFHTLLIWFCYYLATYICMLAMPGLQQMTPLSGLLVLTIGSFGMVAPVQGGYGPFEFMVISALTQLYSVPALMAEGAAITMHNSQTVFVLLTGAVGLLYLSAKRQQPLLPKPGY
jgi:glycosyltransferase 2 family protein